MRINIQRLVDWAKVPKQATDGAAGMDLTATSKDDKLYYTEYGTGLAIEIPMGYAGFIFPRSSISKHPCFSLANAVGVIDSDYRGELKCRFRGSYYKVGDRIAQLVIMPVPVIELAVTDSLTDTARGGGGFGSTS
jgi:dUTP pyrophosphatase